MLTDAVFVATTVTLSLLTSVVAFMALAYVVKTSSFHWVRQILLLCALQNVGAAVNFYADYLELSPSSSSPMLVGWLKGLSMFAFIFLSSLIYWLYALKYLVISVEVPRELYQDQLTWFTEQRQQIVKWAGIAINLGVAIVLAVSRGVLCY